MRDDVAGDLRWIAAGEQAPEDAEVHRDDEGEGQQVGDSCDPGRAL